MTRHILKIVWNRKRANALIVAEIFLSFLVVFAVMTLASALAGGLSQPLGFDWRDVWNVSVDISSKPGEAPAQRRESIAMIMRELESMPEIVNVAVAVTPAYSMSSMEGSWDVNGKTVSLARDEVSDDFAAVMRLELIQGRWFQSSDDALGYVPVVIDADLARAVYENENPVGQRFDAESERDIRVVGVVKPYRKSGEFANFGKPVNMLFERVSLTKSENVPDNILIRLSPGTTAAFEGELVKRLHAIAPERDFRIRHMSSMRDFALRTALLPLLVFGTIAGFLIVMVILGLSGVMWQNVTRRRREIGLRRAVGASGPSVQKQIIGEVAMLTTLAVILGVVVISQLPLLGLLTVITPGAFAGGVAGSLAAIYALTILCGAYPGWLASRVQPAEALHYE